MENKTIAFAHESATGELNPPSKKDGALTKIAGTVPKTIATIFCVLCLLLLWAYDRGTREYSSDQRQTINNIIPVPPIRMGWDSIIITREFGERFYNDDRFYFDNGSVTKDNLIWEVEYDGDPTKRYRIGPRNAPIKCHFMYTNMFKFLRTRIWPDQPDQTTMFCEYTFERIRK